MAISTSAASLTSSPATGVCSSTSQPVASRELSKPGSSSASASDAVRPTSSTAETASAPSPLVTSGTSTSSGSSADEPLGLWIVALSDCGSEVPHPATAVRHIAASAKTASHAKVLLGSGNRRRGDIIRSRHRRRLRRAGSGQCPLPGRDRCSAVRRRYTLRLHQRQPRWSRRHRLCRGPPHARASAEAGARMAAAPSTATSSDGIRRIRRSPMDSADRSTRGGRSSHGPGCR